MRRFVNAGEKFLNVERIDDDVSLEANGISFTNTEAGRVIGQFKFLAPGSVLVNEVGGYIGASLQQDPFTFTALIGSAGADRVVDSGSIAGLVDLGDGNDQLISRNAGSTYATSAVGATLGGGDDLLRFEGSTAPFFVFGNGGDGYDTFEFAATTNQVLGSHLTGFEKLSLHATGNYSEFSGYLEIGGGAAPAPFTHYNFLDGNNPLATLSLNGGNWTLRQSTVAEVRGSGASESLALSLNSRVSGSILLGGGDDEIIFDNGRTAATSATAIDGGVGSLDRVTYRLTGASLSDSLTMVTGFERLNVTTNVGQSTGFEVSLTNLSGFTGIHVENGLKLVLASSDIASAQISGALGGSILLNQGVKIGRYTPYNPEFPFPSPVPLTPDIRSSNAFINRGVITGDISFANGDDLYDGIAGKVEGEVRGDVGNDRLLGGIGSDTFYGDVGADTLQGNAGDDKLNGGAGSDTVDGGDGIDLIDGGAGSDRLIGGTGNDTLDGGSNVDTAVVSGNRSAYTVTQTSTGNFQAVGPDGTDSLSNIEYLQFADQTIRLLPGTGTTVDFSAAASTFMGAIRDFDGNDLGGASGWKRLGAVDVNGDGDADQIFVNPTIGRFAELATAADGKVYFSDHGWAGETRVVGIYVDPLVQSGQVVAGSDFDSQRRFQNDLRIDNLGRVLGGADYDRNGSQEVYFKIADGTAYLHAYMHADGNIQYANYQTEAQVIEFLTQNGWAASTYDGWFA